MAENFVLCERKNIAFCCPKDYWITVPTNNIERKDIDEGREKEYRSSPGLHLQIPKPYFPVPGLLSRCHLSLLAYSWIHWYTVC